MPVVYVAGTMRSGTTIVGQLLAASPDTVLIGEVRPILLDPDDHRHCDCGKTRDSCPFWSSVWRRLAAVPTPAEAQAAYRIPGLPTLLLAVLLRRPAPRSAQPVVSLLRAIAATAGERTVIDTSKSPAGVLLWRLAGADVRVVHALRGPREVAAAQARPTAESGLVQEPKAKTYAVWTVYNALAFLMQPFARGYTLVRYRQLRNAARRVATRLWQRSAVPPPADDTGARFDYTESHVLAGNPRRTRGTSVTIMPTSRSTARSTASDPLPDFVIIGAQKASSTALMYRLSQHPRVFLPAEETRYFRYPWFEFQDESALRDAVRTTKPGVLRRGIKCPDLLCVDEYADRVVAALPDAKLLAVLREPVSRAVSGYFWLMQWGYLPVAPVEEGLSRILDGGYDADWPRAQEVLEFGRYGTHLAHWLQLVPRQQLFVLVDEDLHRDPAATLRQTFEFLEVETDVAVQTARRPDNSGLYSLPRLRFVQRRVRYIMREFPGFEGRYLQPPANRATWIADRALAAFDRGVLARRHPNARPQISADLRQRLTEYYRPDVKQLEDLLERELPHWHHPVG